MKTAVDTNILLDVLSADARWGQPSLQSLIASATAGPIAICPVVQAELVPAFDDGSKLDDFLAGFGIQVDQLAASALWAAGMAWRTFALSRGQQVQCPRCGNLFSPACPQCGNTVVWRQHLITAFLIGGHALVQADRLLTRDACYYRRYFPSLNVIFPGSV